MTTRIWLWIVSCIFFSTVAAAAADSVPAKTPRWELVIADEFDRKTPGANWQALLGNLSVVDGHLRLEASNSAIAVCTKPFPGDVRIECDGWTEPGAVPCDLTILLARNRERGPTAGYFLGYGSYQDTRNRLRVDGRTVATNDSIRIGKPGTRHRLVAQKAGGRISLEVDGELMYEWTDPDPRCGPLEDRIGFYCWNSAIGIDNVRIYRGAAPPPPPPREILALPIRINEGEDRLVLEPKSEDPHIQAGLDAYHRGDLNEAFDEFQEAKPDLAKVAGLTWVVGHLDFFKEQPGLEALKTAFAELPERTKQTERVEILRRLLERFEQGIDREGRERAHNLYRLLAAIDPEHPFYRKALLNRGRLVHWEWRESGSAYLKAARDRIFADLREIAPASRLVRVYSGERVPWGEEYTDGEAAAPEWARHLREAYRRCNAVVAWWGENRQAADGSLGGGWGDDVEILRSWGPLALIANANPQVRQTVTRLVDGVWESPVIAQSGFAVGMADVEHSAEPSADSQPIMLAIDYGNPVYAERNLKSVRLIRNKLMGWTPRGHFHWKSNQVCAEGASDSPLFAADVPYAVRAFKHVVWLAWYSGHPEAEKMIVDWARSWLEDSLRTDDGKPRGVVPAGVGFPDESLGRKGERWWDPDLGWDYYLWSAGRPGGMYDLFAIAWARTGDEAFLEPYRVALEYAKRPRPKSVGEPGSETWVTRIMQETMYPQAVRSAALARFLTGDTRFDAVLKEHGPAYQRFLLTGDRTIVERMARGAAESMRTNFEMMTSEVLMTDRAGVNSGAPAALYCGLVRPWDDSGMPCFAVNWDSPTENFAAVVTEAESNRLKIVLYNFEDKPIDLGARSFQLTPGDYRLTTGPDPDDDWTMDRMEDKRNVSVDRRGQRIGLRVPVGVTWVVQLRESGSPATF